MPPMETEANPNIPIHIHTGSPFSLLNTISGPVYPSQDLMGNYLSHRSADLPTAKLVVTGEAAGGFIIEFPEHVKVYEILRERPGFFICHADSMRYDEFISPLSAEHELQVEHLYFLLPLNRLRHSLSATDMVALAVEASTAMEQSRHRYKKLGRRRGWKITPSVITVEQEVREIDHLDRRETDHEIINSGQFKGEGYNSETLDWKRVGVDWPVRSKRQRRAPGQKRVNTASFNGPWRMKLWTIHEEGFQSLIDIT